MSRHGWRTISALALGLLTTLGAVAPAQAALGGPAAAFANRPNLRSVTFNGSVASFNFDRPVRAAEEFAPGAFRVGGYAASRTAPTAMAANVSISSPTTVLVTYTGLPDDPDLAVLTFGAVQAGAVRGFGTFAEPNLTDATPVTGATGATGTRGRTTGPDLLSVSLDIDDNRITYVFDQGVSGTLAPPDPAAFRFADAAGALHGGTGITRVDRNAVIVTFADSVAAARQALVAGGAVRAAGTLEAAAAPMSVDVPGRPRLMVGPSMVDATLETGSGTITFVFDRTIGTVDASRFAAQSSTGVLVPGASATILPGDTHKVRVTFGTSQFTEHIVGAAISTGAAVSTGGEGNVPGGRPVGGNAGAQATGFTSGPDAIAATFNREAGQVTVTFDSRLLAGGVDPAQFVPLSVEGVAVGAATAVATVETSSRPGPVSVVLQYHPEQLEVATAMQVGGHRVDAGAWVTGGGHAVTGTAPGAVADAQDVQTILVPTETTTVYRGLKSVG